MEKEAVYLETTVVSYLTARPSRDVIRLAHQEITRSWWAERSDDFSLYISELVDREVRDGDPVAADERIALIAGLPMLRVSEEAVTLAELFVARGLVPIKAGADALHIAIAAVNAMQFVLTWNCTHIANAQLREKIAHACRVAGYEPAILCTPEELMGRVG